MLSHRDPWFGWSAGFVALCLNFLVTALTSMLTPSTAVQSRLHTVDSLSIPVPPGDVGTDE